MPPLGKLISADGCAPLAISLRLNSVREPICVSESLDESAGATQHRGRLECALEAGEAYVNVAAVGCRSRGASGAADKYIGVS